MNIFDLTKSLEQEGWRFYDRSTLNPYGYLAKRFRGHRPCECNADKPGIQVVVNLHRIYIHNDLCESVEVDVTGEYKGHWYKLASYSLNPQEFYDDRHNICGRLLAAWDNLQSVPMVAYHLEAEENAH